MIFVEQVQTLLSQATPDRIYRLNGVGGMPGQIVDRRAYIGKNGPNTYIALPGASSLISEPAQLLERLYAAAHREEQRVFTEILMTRVNRENARVVARTLAVTGHLYGLNFEIRDEGTWEELWRGLIHTMRFEPSLFGEQDLQAVEAAAQARLRALAASEQERLKQTHRDIDPSAPVHVKPRESVIDEARAVMQRIRYLGLSKAIRENRNPAIDTDRQQLLSRLQAMGFSATLSKASDEIERRAALATTELDVKTVMDLARTFLEEVIEEACRKIESKVGKPVPSGAKLSHYAPYRQYLENAGFLGPEESMLLQWLYNFLSNQGAHKLSAAPEQLRVAHATVVEWCLLVVGRVKALTGM